MTAGFEAKFNDYQWIDVIRPWVGAPIGESDGASTGRLGDSSDIWRVKPRRGAVFGTHQIRYRGLIANAGIRRIAFGEFYRDEKIYTFSKQLGIELVEVKLP